MPSSHCASSTHGPPSTSSGSGLGPSVAPASGGAGSLPASLPGGSPSVRKGLGTNPSPQRSVKIQLRATSGTPSRHHCIAPIYSNTAGVAAGLCTAPTLLRSFRETRTGLTGSGRPISHRSETLCRNGNALITVRAQIEPYHVAQHALHVFDRAGFSQERRQQLLDITARFGPARCSRRQHERRRLVGRASGVDVRDDQL